jgi:hypothetical protein
MVCDNNGNQGAGGPAAGGLIMTGVDRGTRKFMYITCTHVDAYIHSYDPKLTVLFGLNFMGV